MTEIYLILFLVAVVCFVLDAFRVVVNPRVNLTALGLAFATTVFLIQQIRAA